MRSRRASYLPSDFLAPTRRPLVPGRALLWRGYANSVGSRTGPSPSNIVGRRGALSATPKSRPNSSAPMSILLSPWAAPCRPCARRPRRSQLSLRSGSIRSVVGWSPVWPSRAARSPASRFKQPLAGKRIELLREVVSELRRLAIIFNVGNAQPVLEMEETKAAALALGLEVKPLEIRTAADISTAFEGVKAQADALYIAIDQLMVANLARILTLALGSRLPTVFSTRDFVRAGGFMSYGPNYSDLFRRSADYVDKILRGAKPGDIPVEQPTRFELVVNLTTAKALGLTIPQQFVLRADEVIE